MTASAASSSGAARSRHRRMRRASVWRRAAMLAAPRRTRRPASTSRPAVPRADCVGTALRRRRRRRRCATRSARRSNASAGSTSSSPTPGSGPRARWPTTATTEWQRCYDVNVMGIVRDPARASLDALRRSPAAADRQDLLDRGDGRPARAGLLLGASKGAVMALTLAMAADHVADGIRVNGVAPGTADTPWVRPACSTVPTDPACRAGRARTPASRWVDSSAPTRSRRRSATWRARSSASDHRHGAGCRRRDAEPAPPAVTSDGCSGTESSPRTPIGRSRRRAEAAD